MRFTPVPVSMTKFVRDTINRIVNTPYIPGLQSTGLYKLRAGACDALVDDLLKDLPVSNPESEVWDNRRKK